MVWWSTRQLSTKVKDQVDDSNYNQPYGSQQWDEPIPYNWCKPKHGNYDTTDYEYKPQYV